MAQAQDEAAGVISRVLTQFPTRPAVSDEEMLENVRSALGRKLPVVGRVGPFKPHGRTMSIAGGGPSLEDTYKDLTGVIVTANAGLGFLLSKGITPWACGLLDARAHVADLIEPHPGVMFFVASTCHPRVFDKLAGCRVEMWHPGGMPGIEALIPGQEMIGGGCTMGLRWWALGYYLGFRKFEAHGLDSSYRGTQTHAYPDYRDGQEPSLVIDGYATALNFLQQISDYKEMLATFAALPEADRPTMRLHGDGLLQKMCAAC